jgi:hypothetical protein
MLAPDHHMVDFLIGELHLKNKEEKYENPQDR